MMKKEETLAAVADDTRTFETEVDELLSMFNTDQISQEVIDRECEWVKEKLSNARQNNYKLS